MPVFKIIERVALYVDTDTPEEALEIANNTHFGQLDVEVEACPEIICVEYHSRQSIEEEINPNSNTKAHMTIEHKPSIKIFYKGNENNEQ